MLTKNIQLGSYYDATYVSRSGWTDVMLFKITDLGIRLLYAGHDSIINLFLHPLVQVKWLKV